MILSGHEIENQLGKNIVIDPFDPARLNPNSYNLSLHDEFERGIGAAEREQFFPLGLRDPYAIVANCCTHSHDPSRSSRLDPFDNEIPYDWGVRHC